MCPVECGVRTDSLRLVRDRRTECRGDFIGLVSGPTRVRGSPRVRLGPIGARPGLVSDSPRTPVDHGVAMCGLPEGHHWCTPSLPIRHCQVATALQGEGGGQIPGLSLQLFSEPLETTGCWSFMPQGVTVKSERCLYNASMTL